MNSRSSELLDGPAAATHAEAGRVAAIHDDHGHDDHAHDHHAHDHHSHAHSHHHADHAPASPASAGIPRPVARERAADNDDMRPSLMMRSALIGRIAIATVVLVIVWAMIAATIL